MIGTKALQVRIEYYRNPFFFRGCIPMDYPIMSIGKGTKASCSRLYSLPLFLFFCFDHVVIIILAMLFVFLRKCLAQPSITLPLRVTCGPRESQERANLLYVRLYTISWLLCPFFFMLSYSRHGIDTPFPLALGLRGLSTFIYSTYSTTESYQSTYLSSF